ncbi:MAG: hypothetical protein ACK56I_33595, partial [bacterium]
MCRECNDNPAYTRRVPVPSPFISEPKQQVHTVQIQGMPRQRNLITMPPGLKKGHEHMQVQD